MAVTVEEEVAEALEATALTAQTVLAIAVVEGEEAQAVQPVSAATTAVAALATKYLTPHMVREPAAVAVEGPTALAHPAEATAVTALLMVAVVAVAVVETQEGAMVRLEAAVKVCLKSLTLRSALLITSFYIAPMVQAK